MIGIVGLGGARYFASNCTIAGPDGSSEQITKELKHLREYSSENNIVGVNKSVKFLLSNSDFWIYCYESIESKPNVDNSGGSLFIKKNSSLGWY